MKIGLRCRDKVEGVLAEITGEIARRLFEFGDGKSDRIRRATHRLAGPFAHVCQAIMQREGVQEKTGRDERGRV